MFMNPGKAVRAAVAACIAASATATFAAEEADVLDEIVVTAQFRQQNLQDTPLAITAVTAELMEARSQTNISEITNQAPSVTLKQQSAMFGPAIAAYIRGVGAADFNPALEPGVGIYVDDVYIATLTGSLLDLLDLERVEILRGPQGTLFGRNTIGGAMQLISRKPGDTFGIDEKLNFGRFSQFSTRTRLDTGYLFGSPVKATLAYLHGQSNGYFDNTLAPSSRAPNAYGNDALWASLYGAFGDRFTAYYTFDYDKRRGTPPFFQMVAATPAVAAYYGRSPMFGGAPFQLSSERLNSGQQAPFEGRFSSYSETLGHDLTLEYKMSDAASLKSVSSYRSFNQDTICSLTGNGVMRGVVLDPVTFAPSIGDLNGPYQCNNAPQRQFQYSEELQLLGHTAQWSYVAGAYYFYERSSEYNRQSFTFVLPGGMAALNLSPVRVFHWALVAAFGAAYLLSESERQRDLHVMFGYTVLGLVAFRLLWGFVGTHYARFSSFLFGPRATLQYLVGLVSGRAERHLGHNPAGSWAIWAILGLAAATGVTGYMTFNELGGEAVEEIHEALANAWLVVVFVHVAGVIASSVMHRENLVRAMVTGRKNGRVSDGIARAWRGVAALMLAAVLGFWSWQWTQAPDAATLQAQAAARADRHQGHHDDDD